MNTQFVSQGFRINDGVIANPTPEVSNDLALEVVKQLRALCDRVEAGELTFRVITFEVLSRGQRVTLETDK